MNKYFRHIFGAYILAYAFFFSCRPLTDPDFWFHLKTGEYILKTRTIPAADLFSFTNFGKPWVAHEWLSGVIFYAIYSRLGMTALMLIFSAISVATFWLVFSKSETHPFISGLALLLSLWAVVPTIGVRPRVFTMLLAGVFLALLTSFARNGKGRSIWLLVPLMIAWVNLHGGFLIGLVLICLTIAGLVIDQWTTREITESFYPRLRTLGLVLLACLLAVMLNPHGPRIYSFPFEIFFSPIQQQLVNDWLSPDFHEQGLLPLALLILFTVAALALSPRRPRPSEVLFFLATLYATLKSSRNMAIFALVAGPLLAEYLQSWLVSTTFGKPFAREPSFASTRSALLFSAILLIPLTAFALKLRSPVFGPPRQEILNVPISAVEFLKEKQISGNTFTDPNIWGDYLIWALPSNPVYIDGRIDMYGDEFVREYLDVIWGISDWRMTFDRYGVKVAIVRSRSPLSRELKAASDWQQVFQDQMATVFFRR